MRCYLLLKSAWHKSPKLRQAVVDPISASLLDDLREKSTRTEKADQKKKKRREKNQKDYDQRL